MNRSWFDDKCRVGVEALCQYHRKKNDSLSTLDKPTFHPEPAHDWSSHPADGFRHIAMAYREGLIRTQVDYEEDDDMRRANSYKVETAA
jgi:hypothetical protein